MLVFDTPGLIDQTAMTVSGINAKLTDSAIGQFGTGLKMAVAVILRLKGRVYVLRGQKLLEFGTKTRVVRGKTFEIVTLNGRELGFTDQLGAHWEPWMAYRELASNTRDEAGEVRQTTEAPAGQSRRTKIVVQCPQIEQVYSVRHTVMLDSAPLCTMPGLEVHSSGSQHLFYRGIRVYTWEEQKHSLYTYCLTDHQYLTEDRTLKYQYGVKEAVTRGLVQCTHEPTIYSVLAADDQKCVERSLPWTSVKEQQPSPQFMQVASVLHERKQLHGTARALFDEYKDTLPGYESPYDVDPTQIMSAQMERAAELLENVGMTVSLPMYRIRSRMSAGPVDVHGDTIRMSASLFEQGDVAIAQAMMYGHILYHRMGGQLFVLSHRLLTGLWPTESDSRARRALEFKKEEVLF